MKSWFGLFSLLILTSCFIDLKTKVPAELRGLWFNTQTMHWDLKIDQHIIFWENRIESIAKIEQNGSNFRILTSSRELYFKLSNDSLRLDGNWYTKTFDDINRRIIETDPITSSGLTVVQGFVDLIDSTKQQLPIELYVNDFILGRSLEYLSDLDSNGVFRLAFEVHGTQDISLRSSHFAGWRKLLVSPGDTLTMNLPGLNNLNNVHFSCRNASANYDIFQMDDMYQKHTPNSIEVGRALGGEPDKYVEFRRNFRESEQKFLENYCQVRDCSNLFKTWFKTHSEVEYLSNLLKFSWQSLNYGFGSQTRLTGELKKNYEKEFMDSIKHDSDLYQLSSSYFSLINGISHRVVDHSEEKIKRFKVQEIDFLLEDELLLTEEERSFLRNHKDRGFNVKELNQPAKEMWWGIEDKMANQLQIFRMKSSYDFFIEDIMESEDNRIRDFLVSQHFYRLILENKNYEIMDWAFEKSMNSIHSKDYQSYLSSIYHEIREQENLIEKLHIKATKYDGTGKQLLQKIKKDYPNQKVVLDFWGTWCQPCLKDFEVSSDLKKRLSNVKFVYFCTNSSEKSWKDALIKYNPVGDHYLLSQRQTYELLESFEVNFFPTYILIDEEGRPFKKVPRPIDEEKFVAFINSK